MSYNQPMIKIADNILREAAINGISKKYNGEMKETATAKLMKELDIVTEQFTASEYIVLYNALNAVGAKTKEYCFRGTAASSLILYSLGLTDVDPLDPDIKLYSEFFYDITGHKTPDFSMNVSTDLHRRLMDYFNDYPGDNHVEIKYDDNGQPIGVYIGELSENYIKGEPYFDTFHIDLIPIENNEVLRKEIMTGNIIDICKPQTLREYVRCFGFAYSTGAWEDNGEILRKDNSVPYEDLIADREDVYEYMLKSGVERSMAFSIAEHVRKGKAYSKGWPKEMADALETAGIPDWYIKSCQKIKYLFPRAHAVSFLKCYLLCENGDHL